MKKVLSIFFSLIFVFAFLGTLSIGFSVYKNRYHSHNLRIIYIDSQFGAFENLMKFYKEDNGKYPDNLESLTPNYFLELPVDPWGNNYHYSIENDKPLIFTFGSDNEKGGKGSARDLSSDMNVKKYLK